MLGVWIDGNAAELKGMVVSSCLGQDETSDLLFEKILGRKGIQSGEFRKENAVIRYLKGNFVQCRNQYTVSSYCQLTFVRTWQFLLLSFVSLSGRTRAGTTPVQTLKSVAAAQAQV